MLVLPVDEVYSIQSYFDSRGQFALKERFFIDLFRLISNKTTKFPFSFQGNARYQLPLAPLTRKENFHSN